MKSRAGVRAYFVVERRAEQRVREHVVAHADLAHDASVDRRVEELSELVGLRLGELASTGSWKLRPMTAASSSSLLVSSESRLSRRPITSRTPSGIPIDSTSPTVTHIPSRWTIAPVSAR